MAEAMHVVCPACGAVNRLPPEKPAREGKCGKCGQALFRGQVLNLDAAAFERHISRNDLPVLVDFWAPWCGPCKMMAPVLDQAAAQLEPRVRVAKLNTETEQALAARYNIRSIPTLALFRGGREIARQAGAMDLATLTRWIGQHI